MSNIEEKIVSAKQNAEEVKQVRSLGKILKESQQNSPWGWVDEHYWIPSVHLVYWLSAGDKKQCLMHLLKYSLLNLLLNVKREKH